MKRLILASGSASRRRLLQAAGLEFETVVTGLDESVTKREALARGDTADQIALTLAQAKAAAVGSLADAVVVGADQTLDLDGRLFDKTADLEETRRVLLTLRGRTFRLHCACVVMEAGEVRWRRLSSPTLSMRAFEDEFLDAYLRRNGAALAKSLGGFEFEGEGVQLFDAVDGDFFAILGLPLVELLSALRDLDAAPC